MIFFVSRYSDKIYERESWPKKVYFCDTGIPKIARFARDFGKLMENCVYIELLRRTNESPMMEIYYYRNIYGWEVDFVIKEGARVAELLQVCFDIEKPLVREREMKSLLQASRVLKCDRLSVVTWNYKNQEQISGTGKKSKRKINFVPLWKWLLTTR